MATNENLIPIPGRLHSVATEGHVAGADEIIDDNLSKDQQTINAEVNAALGEGGTVDEKIAEAIDDALENVAFIDDSESSPAVVPGFDPTTDTVHVTAQTLSESQKAQVRTNIGLNDVDARISNAVASEASQRAAAVSGVQASVNAEATRAQAAESALQNNIEALTQSNIVVVADHTSVSSPDPYTIYREQGTNTYSDWMYQNGSWNKMAEYDNAIDDEPTSGSDNLVKSGGTFEDISDLNVKTFGDFYSEFKAGHYVDGSNGSIGSSSEWNSLVFYAPKGIHITFKWSDNYTLVEQWAVYSQKPKDGANPSIMVSGSNYPSISSLVIPNEQDGYWVCVCVHRSVSGCLIEYDSLQRQVDSNTEKIDLMNISVNTASDDIQKIFTAEQLIKSSDNYLNPIAHTFHSGTNGGEFNLIVVPVVAGDTLTFLHQPYNYGKIQLYSQEPVIPSDMSDYFIKEVTAYSFGKYYRAVIPSDIEGTVYACDTIYISNNEQAFSKNERFVLKNAVVKKDIDNLNSDLVSPNKYGFVPYPKIGTTDYCLIVMYGQSLSIGYESLPYSDTNLNPKNLKFSHYLRPEINDISTAVFEPLCAVRWEDPDISTVNCLAELYRRMIPSANVEFIASSLGDGARTLYELSKYNTSGEYNTRFLPSITRMKALADAAGKTISSACIIFMQGESGGGHNDDYSIDYSTPDGYKEGLRQLKEDMQADIVSIFGQSANPLFFTYMTSRNIPVALKQIELSQEDNDVALLNPIYPVPDYNNLHLSSNGYRWYGEYIAKAIFNFMFNGERQNCVEPMYAYYKDGCVRIKCKTDFTPLVIDTWTVQPIDNYGFQLSSEGSALTINSMHVEYDEIVINVGTIASGSTIDIYYADSTNDVTNTFGVGNVRDSDRWQSMQLYIDDTNDHGSIPGVTSEIVYRPKDQYGNYIFGKNYPMQNWLRHFRMSLTV